MGLLPRRGPARPRRSRDRERGQPKPPPAGRQPPEPARRPTRRRPYPAPMRRRVLVAGFRRFGARRRNESEAVVRALARLRALRGRARFVVLPVSWRRGPPRAVREALRDDVGAIVLLGEAGGRTRVTPE